MFLKIGIIQFLKFVGVPLTQGVSIIVLNCPTTIVAMPTDVFHIFCSQSLSLDTFLTIIIIMAIVMAVKDFLLTRSWYKIALDAIPFK